MNILLLKNIPKEYADNLAPPSGDTMSCITPLCQFMTVVKVTFANGHQLKIVCFMSDRAIGGNSPQVSSFK